MKMINMDHFYPHVRLIQRVSDQCHRDHRRLEDEGMKELSLAGWQVLEVGKKRFLVTRPPVS